MHYKHLMYNIQMFKPSLNATDNLRTDNFRSLKIHQQNKRGA